MVRNNHFQRVLFTSYISENFFWHGNICVENIYEQAPETHCVVTEMVEGATRSLTFRTYTAQFSLHIYLSATICRTLACYLKSCVSAHTLSDLYIPLLTLFPRHMEILAVPWTYIFMTLGLFCSYSSFCPESPSIP